MPADPRIDAVAEALARRAYDGDWDDLDRLNRNSLTWARTSDALDFLAAFDAAQRFPLPFSLRSATAAQRREAERDLEDYVAQSGGVITP